MRIRWAFAAILLATGGAARSMEPSPTLQQRLDAACPGGTVSVPAGMHVGNLRINKPLRLVGETGAMIHGDGTESVIHILAPDVTVERVGIFGSGKDLSADHAGILIEGDRAVIRDNTLGDVLHGIYIKGVSQAVIERNTILSGSPAAGLDASVENAATCSSGPGRGGNGIHFWNSQGNLIRGNFVSGMRDGIYLSFTRESRIENNRANACRYGLHYMYSDSNEIIGNLFANNAAGAALMFSKNLVIRDNSFAEHRGQRAGGIVLHSVDYSRMENNLLTHNRAGLYLQNCNANTFAGNRLVKNYLGMRLTGSSVGNRFLGNRIGGNLHNVDLAGRDNGNIWDDGERGNHWQDAGSPDLDGDGVGEWPHREADILGAYRQNFPLVGLLSAGPFVQAVQFAFQRAPMPGVPYIRDNRPLCREGLP